jgi:hypothetical protein
VTLPEACAGASRLTPSYVRGVRPNYCAKGADTSPAGAGNSLGACHHVDRDSGYSAPTASRGPVALRCGQQYILRCLLRPDRVLLDSLPVFGMLSLNPLAFGHRAPSNTMKWADASIVPGFFPICKPPGVFCPIRVRTLFKHHMARCRSVDVTKNWPAGSVPPFVDITNPEAPNLRLTSHTTPQGAHLALVTSDADGGCRPSGTYDMGAYEFTVTIYAHHIKALSVYLPL